MTQNDEMRAYLDYLIGHERECARENCCTCRSTQNIYESVKTLIFSGVPYPEVTLTARRAGHAATSTGGGRRTAKKAA